MSVRFTTHHGTVTAASDWNGPAERKRVRPALAGSYEEMFHDTAIPQFLLTWREGDTTTEGLRDRKLERAIGVVYLPETERMSHYFWARLRDQFDVVLHFDKTRAVEPLARKTHKKNSKAASFVCKILVLNKISLTNRTPLR